MLLAGKKDEHGKKGGDAIPNLPRKGDCISKEKKPRGV